MATKKDLKLAYDAGQTCARTEPGERQGVSACPFAEGTDERREWLQGFSDEVNKVDPVTMKSEVDAALKKEKGR